MSARRKVSVGLVMTSLMATSACGVITAPPPRPAAAAASGQTAPPDSSSVAPATGAEAQVRGFSQAEQAALRVRNIGCGGVSTGSGFAISNHAFVTNRHVVGGAALLQVSGYDGRDIKVTTAGAATIADLALVRTVEPLPATIPLAAANPSSGAAVTAIGFPLGGPLTTTHGRVLGYTTDPIGWSQLPMLENDAPIEHGSSGSALLDNQGELVGVVYATSETSARFAVPVEILRDLLNDPATFTQTATCGGEPPSSESTKTRCSGIVWAGSATSCAFALNVEAAWEAVGGGTVTVRAESPVTNGTYSMSCDGGTPVICTGANKAVVYIDR